MDLLLTDRGSSLVDRAQMSLFLRHYTLARNYAPTSGPAVATAGDAEKGRVASLEGDGAVVELDKKEEGGPSR